MEFIDPEFKSMLVEQGMDTPDKVWTMTLARVDDPNRARGGWSEVGRYELPEPVNKVDTLYIKRQEDFTYRQLTNPVTRRPTLRKEYEWLQWCQARGVPSIRPLAYWDYRMQGKCRAIMITAGLSQHIPLTEVESSDYRKQTGFGERRALLRTIARVIALMHANRLQHRCLYSKHIFIRRDWRQHDHPDVRLIDLEKARSLGWLEAMFGEGIFRDLDSLNRHAKSWSRSERLYFLMQYANGDRAQARMLARELGISMQNALAREQAV